MNTLLSRRARADPPALLRPVQLACLAAAVFVVSAGYGALMPLLPGWLKSMMPVASATDLARHVGYLGGAYAAGVLVGAPLWGFVADRVGRGPILIIGLVGYVASLLALLAPAVADVWGIYALRFATGCFVAAVIPVVSALVAGYTSEKQRARRFAWLSAVSLLGFLFGPGLIAVADWLARLAGERAVPNVPSSQAVIVLSALLGAVIMLGLAATLPTPGSPVPASNRAGGVQQQRPHDRAVRAQHRRPVWCCRSSPTSPPAHRPKNSASPWADWPQTRVSARHSAPLWVDGCSVPLSSAALAGWGSPIDGDADAFAAAATLVVRHRRRFCYLILSTGTA